jgi:hypothetical protein
MNVLMKYKWWIRLSRILRRKVQGPRVFGIGMSKTGTTSLEDCFRTLGLTPTSGHRVDLKNKIAEDLNPGSPPVNNWFNSRGIPLSPNVKKELMEEAAHYKSLQHGP